MNEELAADFRTRLVTNLPFLDRAVGLVRPYTTTVPNGDDVRRVTLPLPVAAVADLPGADCEATGRYLIPDQYAGAILFFEDGGTISRGAGLPPGERTMESTLRLLLWLNPARLSGPLPEPVLVAALHRALAIGERRHVGHLRDLLTTWRLLPAGGPALFGAYSYAADTPLLLPPYRCFGAELTCNYRFAPACLTFALPTLVPAPPC